MRWSKLFIHTLKEAPSDAEINSHKLFIRGGIIQKVAQGIYTYGYLGLRSLRKLETIIRDEMNRAESQEVLMPMVHPKALWEESGRWPIMTELLKFRNKNDQEFCLGATHEEVICDFVRGSLKSYRSLPMSLYQIQTKYRDEIRPRLGLMRGREFLMKDAYSFDGDKESSLKSYEVMKDAYHRIFGRLGLDYCMVEADSGAIGGNLSHEFQILADSGMDRLLRCSKCDYASNEEVTPVIATSNKEGAAEENIEEFSTPGLKTIEDLANSLNCSTESLVKTFFLKSEVDGKQVFYCCLVPGHREVNLVKLKSALGLEFEPEACSPEEVYTLTGTHPGSCGPVNFAAGAELEIVLDHSLKERKNMIVGANKDDVHLKGVCVGRDFKTSKVADISLALQGDACPSCGSKLDSVRGAEVGHIFHLGQKYSQALGVKFLDKNGKAQHAEMGCYGIGVSRTLQAAIEQNHDDNGMIWPSALAPFQVHICLLDETEKMASFLAELTGFLDANGLDYLIDDRKERPGFKFKDADLLGFPYRFVLGKRSFEKGIFEFKKRSGGESVELPIENFQESLTSLLASKSGGSGE